MTSKPRKENPMSCYKHFTTKERESLLVLLKKGQKNTEIAKELGRSPSSISREIRRNAATREEYSAIRAEEQYRERSVESRKTIGHWEGDTVRGAKWSGCIGTQVERVSRYAVLFKIPDQTAASFTEANI